MQKDYSPTTESPRWFSHRSILLSALLLIVTAALFARGGTAAAPEMAAAVTAVEPKIAASAPDKLPQFDDLNAAASNEILPVPAASDWRAVKVKSGQTLSTLFESEGLPPEDWIGILNQGGDALRLKRIKAGDVLRFRKDGDRLIELAYPFDERHTLQVRREGDRFEALTLEATIERRPVHATGVIASSLFAAGLNAGLSNTLIMQMADIFGYDVDFALDLRAGDRFTVIYEQLYKDGKKLRDGDILAAEFVNEGKAHRAVRFASPDGSTAYYNPQGQSLRKAFLRTPLDFARITSGFSLARWHPVLNRIRAHKGVDYAAGTGTPIKSAGDGRIAFKGVKGGYGRVVVVKHGASVETLYAHMSSYRSGLSVGSRVRQGQVIGYVGMSGLATGPHLHYEFRVGGIHKNPAKVTLPRANPLARVLLTQFQVVSAPMLAQLDNLGHSQFAQAGLKPSKAAR